VHPQVGPQPSDRGEAIQGSGYAQQTRKARQADARGFLDPGAQEMLARQPREQQGLSREDLAERTKKALSVSTIKNVEDGRTRPYPRTLQQLCKALGLDKTARDEVWTAWRAKRPGSRQELETKQALLDTATSLNNLGSRRWLRGSERWREQDLDSHHLRMDPRHGQRPGRSAPPGQRRDRF
jgi:transcriptional regulator with XRE-family HTH domain